MFINRVFTGFTKDGKYRCLQLKYKKFYVTDGYVNGNVYVDLETKEVFDYNQVDHSTLKPITNLVGNKSNMARRKVVNAYQADADKMYSLNMLYYGDIVSCLVQRGISETGGTISVGIKPNLEESNVLFYKIEDDTYKSLRDEDVYDTFKLLLTLYNKALYEDISQLYVDSIRPLKSDEKVLTKRKVLEMDYRKELK